MTTAPPPDVSTLAGKTTPPKSPTEWQREFPEGWPEVVRWARIQSLNLPTGAHRWILIVLAYFANQEGWAQPSQDTIAEYTGISRATVCSILQDLELIGLVTSELRHDEERYHKKYRLALESQAEWPESPEAAKKSIAQRIADSKREQEEVNEQQNDEIARLRLLLSEAGIDPDSTPASVNSSEISDKCQTTLQEGRRRREEYPNLENSSSLLPGAADQVSSHLTLDTRKIDEMKAWVDENWNHIRLSADKPDGWKMSKPNVKDFYSKNQENLDRYEADRAALEAKLQGGQNAAPSRMTLHERRVHFENQIPIRGEFRIFGDDYSEDGELNG